MHQDLHSGNILIGDNYNYIADLGLCRLANERNKKKVYGVLPYIAPEILLGEPYTQAADIYSFGIVAYELLANSYPYADLKLDDTSLAFKIYKNPTERPKKELFININQNNVEFASQVQEIEEEYSHWSQNTPYYIYCNMVTTSRPINTKEIVQLFQKSKKRALEQELKKIEKEISQPLTEEQKELIKFIKDLENLEELEIEGNPKLIEILEPYDDWKDHQKDLQESNKDTLELLKNIRVLEKEKKSLNIKYTELKKFLKEKTFILLSRDAKQELVNKLDKEFREKENLLLIPGKTKELMLSTEEAIKSVKEIKKDLEEELDKSKTKIKELEKRLKEFREKDTYYQELKKSVEQKKKELEELKNVVITNNQLKEDDLDDILEAQERGDYKKLKRARRNLMMFAQRISEQEINNLCQLQKVIVELEVELGETEKKQIYQININGGYNINNFGSKFYDSSFGGNINAEQQGIENLIAQIESLPKN
ncbi:18997_t:CDS:2 [Funneliformis geosporum]|uniref:18997_t:CDS:1 n=1 Tax=Funneliformis geosporum TaxID=1117311 RepID=A0A9W4WIM5_9GLOM|nr:18997_t:CDS:2 [Funneliformis geosporum]